MSSLEGVLECKIDARSFNIRVELRNSESELRAIQLCESENEDLESIEAHVGDWLSPAKVAEKPVQGVASASSQHAIPVAGLETREGGKTAGSNHEGQRTLVSRVPEARERVATTLLASLKRLEEV